MAAAIVERCEADALMRKPMAPENVLTFSFGTLNQLILYVGAISFLLVHPLGYCTVYGIQDQVQLTQFLGRKDSTLLVVNFRLLFCFSSSILGTKLTLYK